LKEDEKAVTNADNYFSAGKPIRLGVLMDVPERVYQYAFPVYDFVTNAYVTTRRLHRGVELVKKIVVGPPSGYIDDVMHAYHALCDEGVLAVIGPNHSDSNIAITPHAEQRKVPLVTLGAVHTHLSANVFNVGWGSLPEDSFTVASWLAQKGYKRVTMTHDNAAHCLMYAAWFRRAAARMGIQLVGDSCVSEVNDDVAREGMRAILAEHRAKNPDAIACFGTGASQINWGRIVKESGWAPPRIMNGAFHQAWYPYSHEFLDGWVGTGMWDDDNRTLAGFRAAALEAYPVLKQAAPELIALYRDGMTALLEGVVNAPILTPDGVRQGLELVRMIPAAMGGDRTVIAFGPYDHKGHKGMDNMVVRRLDKGKLVMEGRYRPDAIVR
jgi:ABC-type branched-subunit amino acid transport system substrate-binding protein